MALWKTDVYRKVFNKESIIKISTPGDEYLSTGSENKLKFAWQRKTLKDGPMINPNWREAITVDRVDVLSSSEVVLVMSAITAAPPPAPTPNKNIEEKRITNIERIFKKQVA